MRQRNYVKPSKNKNFKLSNAKSSAPEQMGCYRLILNGEVMYVGKAESGLQNRLTQHYNNSSPDCASERKIKKNRNELYVVAKVLDTKEKCIIYEKIWIEMYDPPWNERVG